MKPHKVASKIDYHGFRTDILALMGLLIVAIIYNVLASSSAYLGKSLIGGAVFILPAIAYLGLRRPKPWRKILCGTLVFGLIFGFVFEFVQEALRSYSVISRVFPKILGVVPLDNILGHGMMAALTFTFYEHFVSKQSGKDVVSRRLKYAVGLAAVVIVAELIWYYLPNRPVLDYPYLVMGLLAIAPPLVYAYRHPATAYQLALMIPYFFVLYFVVELVAVSYDWWIYPGSTYVGWVQISGLRYPAEELLFWMLCYAGALVSYYKVFIEGKTSD